MFTTSNRGAAFSRRPMRNIWSSFARRWRRPTLRWWTSRWTASTASIRRMLPSATRSVVVEQEVGGRGRGAGFAEHSHARARRQGFEAERWAGGRYAGTRGGVWRRRRMSSSIWRMTIAVSEDPFFIVQVIEKVNSPWLRASAGFRQFAEHARRRLRLSRHRCDVCACLWNLPRERWRG